MAELMSHTLSGGPDSIHVHRRPPLRISQVTSACSFCKTRKIKCDGNPPVCGGCTRFGRSETCSLASDEGSRLSRDYPAYLHDRVQKLQHHLQSLRGEVPDPTRGAASGRQPTIPQQLDETPTSVDTMIADIGAVPILASSYSSTGEGPTLSSILLGAASKQFSPLTAGQQGTSIASLPRKDVCLRLIQHYIDHVYPRLPFFSIQGFWAQFNFVYSQVEEPQEAGASTGHVRPQDIDRGYSTFTILLVLAIASSSLSRSADSVVSSRAQRLFHAALEYRESAVRANTIVGVQSLLFLIQYATLNPSILDAWYLIGVGIRSCIDLGLHQDPYPLESVSPSLLETRRRLWWSIYSFDRSISLGCGRPIGISDSMITARLPTFRIESMATEDQIQGYLQRYRALQIQSEICDKLDHAAEEHQSPETISSELLGKLESWGMDNLPSYDQTLIESEWLMGRILLYRPCRLIRERTPLDLSQLWEAARRFSTLYRQLVESNGIFYVQIAAEKLYWVGLASLYSYWHLRTEVSNSTAEPIKEFELWKLVQDVLFSIRTLSERWEDGSILARHFEEASTQVVNLKEDTPQNGNHSPQRALPEEVRRFSEYISLTSVRATQQYQGRHGSYQQDGELRQLISDMPIGPAGGVPF